MNPRIPQIIAELVQLESQLRANTHSKEMEQLLSTLKLHAAELYLETDMEMIARAKQVDPVLPQSPVVEESISLAENPVEPILEAIDKPLDKLFKPEFEDDIETQISEEHIQLSPITEPIFTEPRVEFEIQAGHENLETAEFDEAEINGLKDLQLSPSIVEENHPEVEENLSPDTVNTPDLFSAEKSETIDNQEEGVISYSNSHLEQKATEILSMFSFSRRFEFGNFLFAGDMKLFAVFITEMLAASNADEREDVFDKWYQERQWSRRDESANDLKRNLKKML